MSFNNVLAASTRTIIESNSSAVKALIGDVITVTNFNQLKSAVASAASGQTIQIASNYLDCASQLVLDKDNSGITIEAAPGYTPVLDFTSFRTAAQKVSPKKTGDGYVGIRIIGGNYTIQGLIIEKAYDNGILIKPNFNFLNLKATNVGNLDNNTIKDCVLRYNGDAGLQISRSKGLEKAGTDVRPDNTHVIGCVSYRNFDILTAGGNANGDYVLDLMKAGIFSNVQAFSLKNLKNPSDANVSIITDTTKQAAIRSEVDSAILKMRHEFRENKIPSYMNFDFWN